MITRDSNALSNKVLRSWTCPEVRPGILIADPVPGLPFQGESGPVWPTRLPEAGMGVSCGDGELHNDGGGYPSTAVKAVTGWMLAVVRGPR